MRRRPKILLGLYEVAGYLHNLHSGFVELGTECTIVELCKHRYRYARTEGTTDRITQVIERLAQSINRIRAGGLTGRYVARVFQAPLLALLFIWSLVRYDVFILTGSSSFCGYLELPLYRLFRKKLIYVFLGSDSRPPYLNGIFFAVERRPDIRTCVLRTSQRKRLIARIDRWAYAVVNIIPQALFHTRPVISSLALGLPFSIRRSGAPKKEICRDRSLVRVLHAPSNLEAKGTRIIRAVVSELKAKGLPIDYVELVERPHDEVLDELEACDFIIDELYSDTPLACFSTEAAFFAKPAVIGSYYAEQLKHDIPAEFIPPSLMCHPDSLASAVEHLVTDKAFREELGARAQRFVKERWNARVVAERFMRVIEGDVPREWTFDPVGIRYACGAGLSLSKVRETVQTIVRMYGKGALQLSDKPVLESILLDMAFGGPLVDTQAVEKQEKRAV